MQWHPSMYNFSPGVTLNVLIHDLIKVIHYAGPKDPWIADRYFSELWYDKEEEFLNEFGE